MEKTEVILSDGVNGEVQLFSNDQKAGEMAISVANGKLTVFHTEVYDAFKDRCFAKLLLDRLVSYAKENNLKILPLCPYVHAQFKRHPDEYASIWLK